ncbi:MAG: hypothetical protein J6R98_07160 [Bacteroidaceae bacterium]|nr:hypothetical protein [Bacteroidaceae bacterium]
MKIQTSNGSGFYIEYADIEKLTQGALPVEEKKASIQNKLKTISGNHWTAKIGLGGSNISGYPMKF